jgi:UDP-N-acetylglucosamine 4-epimerase
MPLLQQLFSRQQEAQHWLVTGAAGFIGSHLVETLLQNNQTVVGLDNFSTGLQSNLDELKNNLPLEKWRNFTFLKGDIADFDTCSAACRKIDYVLHHAALASVPLSISSPLKAHEANVTGFINMLTAARDAKVKRFIYASSSAVYGNSKTLPKREDEAAQTISPYAANKHINEIYAKTFSQCYQLETIGLRYFNAFGSRQTLNGAYAAVIPKWIHSMMAGEEILIFGDGEQSRDFVSVEDVVQANIRAALTSNDKAINDVFNIALGEPTTLNQLFEMLRSALDRGKLDLKPTYHPERKGDIKHSYADISKAIEALNYSPNHTLQSGLESCIHWHCKHSDSS